MNTNELVKEIAVREGLTQVVVDKVVKSAAQVITDALAVDDAVRINNFGTFTAQHKNERKGRNPRTGEEMVIPAHASVKFSMAKSLKDTINAH